MKLQFKKAIIIVCAGLLPSLAFADGVTSSTVNSQGQSPAVQALLAQEQATVPKNLVTNAIMNPQDGDNARRYLSQVVKRVQDGDSSQASASQSSVIPQAQPELAENTQQSSSNAQPTALPTNSNFGSTSVNQQAFANMLKTLMPLSPQQIYTLRKLFDSSQRSIAQYPGTPPKPTSSSMIVDLAPGAAPPVVRLRAGYITSVDFIDSTGQPWPIQAYDIGDPNSFNVQWNKKGNTLLVQANSAYKSGNLAVILKGQDTPVMITLMPGQRAVDYRVDMRLPGLGPNASPQLSNLAAASNPQLINFLDGVPPQSAKAVQVQGGPCQAWTYGGHLYIRTDLTVLSPSWLSSMSSPDGTHVYELMKAPVVLASYRGEITQLTIQGL